MNLDELRTFLEVIDSGTLVAAAPRLNVTPSTVTARINALEGELGCQLLHRHKSGTELTSAGFKLQRYAELISQLWRQARYEVALPPGVEGVCNVGLEFDLWRHVGARFLDHMGAHAPATAVALWPAEQRQLQRWLDIGLIDIAFCYQAQAGEGCTSRLLLADDLLMVAAGPPAGIELDSRYVYIDHGDEFRRQHAEAFPGARPALVTISAADWGADYLLRHQAKGYLPRRVIRDLLSSGALRTVQGAPRFRRNVYLVENVRTVGSWPWYEAAVESIRTANGSRRRPAVSRRT